MPFKQASSLQLRLLFADPRLPFLCISKQSRCLYRLTDGRDGSDDFAELKFVENGCFASSV